MSFNTDGTLKSARPNQPNTGNYIAPAVNVHSLKHQKLYDAAPLGQTLPLALHHISSWQILWRFWNALIAREWFDAARNFLSILGVNKAKTNKLAADCRATRFADTSPAGIATDVVICWSEWNLVRGPSNRSDDPNEEVNNLTKAIDFRDYNKGTIGARLTALVEMADVMVMVINMPTFPTNEDALSEKIKGWTALARYPLVEFDEALWLIDTDSPPYSSVPDPNGGAIITHPTWRIHRKHKGT